MKIVYTKMNNNDFFQTLNTTMNNDEIKKLYYKKLLVKYIWLREFPLNDEMFNLISVIMKLSVLNIIKLYNYILRKLWN